jgi:hypothetical protein
MCCNWNKKKCFLPATQVVNLVGEFAFKVNLLLLVTLPPSAVKQMVPVFGMELTFSPPMLSVIDVLN